MKFSIAVLQSPVESASVAAFVGGEGALAFEGVFFEATLVDVGTVFENSVFFGAILVVSLEEVVVAFLFSFPMEDIVFEVSSKDDISSYVDSFSVSSAEFDFSLVVVSVGVHKSSEVVGQACSENTLVVPSRRIVVLAVAVGFAVVPLSLIHNPSPHEFEKLIGFLDSTLTLEPAVALLFD